MENLSSIQFDKNLFYVHNNNGEGIIYSPIQGKFFTADGDAQSVVDEYINGENKTNQEFYDALMQAGMWEEKEEPEAPEKMLYKPTTIMLSLSNLCNLRCVYCYAEAGNSTRVLSWGFITQAIQAMFNNAIDTKAQKVELFFHGTGETLVLWKTFKDSVQYALSHKPDSIEILFSVVTNGTLLDSEKVEFLARNDFAVTLSMDGVQSIQDKQRPSANGKGSYADVVKGIRLLVDSDIPFIVRPTVTGESVELMSDFVQMCADLGCSEISFMPFSAVGRGAHGVSQLSAEAYIRNYLKAKKLAKELGISVEMAGTDASEISSYYCDAVGYNCVVTPEGDISNCSRVTNINDPLANIFFVGNITETGFHIDQGKVDELINHNLYNYPQCKDCFAKFICSGGCPHDRLSSGNEMASTWCEIIKNLVWYEIRELALAQ